MIKFEFRGETWYVPSDKITEIRKNPASGGVLIYTVKRDQDPFVIMKSSEVRYIILDDFGGVGGLNAESQQKVYHNPYFSFELAKEENKDRGIIALIKKLLKEKKDKPIMHDPWSKEYKDEKQKNDI